MQGRFWCGIALGVVSTLGGWGCSAAPKRSEAPLQFHQWKPGGGASAKVEKPKPSGDDTFPVTPTEVAEATPRPSIWNYRPGSLLFHRKPAAPPATPTGPTEAGALSRYFPGLSGKTKGDGLRLTLKNHSPFGSPAPAGGSVAATGGTAPLLAVGLKIETQPRAPSSSLPDSRAVARQDRKADAEPAETPVKFAPSSDASLTSHETITAPTSMAPASDVDPLSLDLPAAPVEDAATAPLDSSSHPAAMEVVAPSRMASVEVSTVVTAPSRMESVEVSADPAPVETAPADPAPSTMPEAPARMEPAGKSTETVPSVEPLKSVEARPKRAVRPSRSRVEPMILPPAEFPATYHAQSMSRVLKEEAPIDVDQPLTPTPATPHRPLFPRLARLMSPKDVKDREVMQASLAKPASTLGESGKVPEWWEAQ